MNRQPPRILIGVMYSGEREYPACLSAISQQVDVQVELFKVENLGNKAAHDTLYAEFNHRRGAFDLLAKIDADMVLNAANALSAVAGVFRNNPHLDHLTIDVFDFLSDMPIPGQNFYSSRVEWRGNPDPLVVDYHGTFTGIAHRILDNPVCNHMPDPDDFQAFAFGVHRCLKAIQPERDARNFHRGLVHWTILSRIFDTYRFKGDRRRLMALGGAMEVLDNPKPLELADYRSAHLKTRFATQARARILSDEEAILRKWSFPLAMQMVWLTRMTGR